MANRLIAAGLAACLTISAAAKEPEAPPPCPEGILGDWVGSYVCAQGLTGLTLSVTSNSGGWIDATFNFYAPSMASPIPSGSYTLQGTFDAMSGAFHLKPVAWINHPPAYAMVGMDGVFDTTAGQAKGMIDVAICRDFQLARRCSGDQPIVYIAPSPLAGEGAM